MRLRIVFGHGFVVSSFLLTSNYRHKKLVLCVFLQFSLSLREKAIPAKTPALTATGIYGGKQNDTPAYSVAYIEKRVTPAWQGFFFQMWVKIHRFGQKTHVFLPNVG